MDFTIPPPPINLASLGDWLELCREYEIPHIAAEAIGSCWAPEILVCAYGEVGEPHANLDALLAKIPSEPDGYAYRWSCCAGHDLKAAMDKKGRADPADRMPSDLGDIRLANIIEEWPKFEPVRLYRRPWVEAMYEGSHPVEFRVYANEGRIQGVSNYYPQRNLPNGYEALARCCIELSEPFLKRESAFSADWLVEPDGSILFLEGGPPHHRGAHPCCFAPNTIDGIALARQEGCVVEPE